MKIPDHIMEKLEPIDNVHLGDKFYCSEMPAVKELFGTLYVKILTGAFPDMSFLDHRKIITETGSGFNVCNILGDWGEFWIEVCQIEDAGDALMLDYDLETNSRFTRRIRDYVRKLEEGIFLGRFHYRWRGEFRFMGFFALIAPELIMDTEDVPGMERTGGLVCV